MAISRRFRLAPLVGLWLIVITVSEPWGVVSAQEPQSEARTVLSERIELPRLVDLCAQRLGLNIEYDAAELTGTLTLRLGAGVSNQKLWALTNRLLAARGFTSVQAPGEESLSIVRIAEAVGTARIESIDLEEATAGFVKVIVPLKHREADKLLASINAVLSRPGGFAFALNAQHLVVADLEPHLRQALEIVALLDVPPPESVTVELPAENIAAAALADAVEGVIATRTAVGGRALRGKLVPTPDGRGLLLVAPAEEVEDWSGLVAQLDRSQPVRTVSYTPRHFSLREVGGLIEELIGPARADDGRWRLVSDALTGTLVITASPAQHEEIQALIDRLEQAAPSVRRPVRSFRVRNRSASDLVEVLQDLAGAGVIGSAPTIGEETGTYQPDRQFSRRDVPGAPAARPAVDGLADPRPVLRTDQLALTADDATNTLIAVGETAALEQLEELLVTLDVRQAQVMIEVLVLGLNESEMLDLGVELQKQTTSGSTIIELSSLFGLGSPALNAATAGVGGLGFSGVVLNPGDYSVLVRALEAVNQGRTMTAPKVLVSNNQEAVITSVLQTPFATTSVAGADSTFNSFGGTLDAGTTLTVRPQIAEGDHLVLEYSVTLSTFAGEAAGDLPPPRQQNSFQSVASIPDGYTIALGGLSVETDTEAESGLPLLRALPIIGRLFQATSTTKIRTRLYVFIRANVLRHDSFADLRHMSGQELTAAEVDDGWPTVAPRVIW